MEFKIGDISGRISSIEAYCSAYSLLEDNDFLPENISDDFREYLKHFDDFEPVRYFCINRDIVICADSINGDVIGWYGKAENLVLALKENYEEIAC